MDLREKLTINPAKTAQKIEDYLKGQVAELSRSGIAIGISGGLDSSTVCALCAKAIGKEKIKGVILKEKQGNPDAEKYARLFAQSIGVETETWDISEALKALGVYRSVIAHIPTRTLREGIAAYATRLIAKSVGEHPFSHSLKGEDDKFLARNKAVITAKQRIRMVYLYKYADENNLLVVGCAHKSEDYTGLFVKFGIDDAADAMPLKDLYRTQILQLAEYLDVPQEILARTPNPDVIPGVEDKYKDILGIAYEQVDLILCGLENKLDDQDIAMQARTDIQRVAQIKALIEGSKHMREPCRYPRLQAGGRA